MSGCQRINNTFATGQDTYKDMANEDEDWSDLDTTLLDGLEEDDIDNS